MLPLYEIQYGVGHQEHSVKVFADRVVIQKAKLKISYSNFGMLKEVIKNILQIAGKKFEGSLGKLNGEYIGINAEFSEIDEVYLKLSKSKFIADGIIVFYLKGKPRKKVTLFNYKDAENAIMFKAKDNNNAQQIKNFVDNMISKN